MTSLHTCEFRPEPPLDPPSGRLRLAAYPGNVGDAWAGSVSETGAPDERLIK